LLTENLKDVKNEIREKELATGVEDSNSDNTTGVEEDVKHRTRIICK
jgi:hypothetical protein